MFSQATKQFDNADACEGDNNNVRTIYQRFQNLLGHGTDSGNYRNVTVSEEFSSPRNRNEIASDFFCTPVSSTGDLMAMSPNVRGLHGPHTEATDTGAEDLLTGTDFTNSGDITMQDVFGYEDMLMDPNTLDYLTKCIDSNNCNYDKIDHGKESLFQKFDPLFDKQRLIKIQDEDTKSSSTSERDRGYETGSLASSSTDLLVSTPRRTTSAGATMLNNMKQKPMQVVPPAVNRTISNHNNVVRSTPVLVRSASAIAPSSIVATERLINFKNNSPTLATMRGSPQHDDYTSQHIDRLHSLKVILQKQEQEVLQLREENKDLKYAVQDLERKLKRMADENESSIEKEKKLSQQVNEKARSVKQLSIVMEEYEKTISEMIGEQLKQKKEFQESQERLISERDQSLNHLSSMESSFSDLHSKYEKSKSQVQEFKEREDIFKQKLAESEGTLKEYEQRHAILEQAISEKLSAANEALENTKKSFEAEITKLNATLKRKDMTVSSLQESLTQKMRDIDELTAICDDLINKVH